MKDTGHSVHKAVVGHLKKGALHAELHIPQGQKIPRSVLSKKLAEAKRTGNTVLEKRIVFAENFSH